MLVYKNSKNINTNIKKIVLDICRKVNYKTSMP